MVLESLCFKSSRPSSSLRALSGAEATTDAAARPVYPFSAIIGQEEMKFAAIMNIIDPNIGGIMVMGDPELGSRPRFARWYVSSLHFSPVLLYVLMHFSLNHTG